MVISGCAGSVLDQMRRRRHRTRGRTALRATAACADGGWAQLPSRRPMRSPRRDVMLALSRRRLCRSATAVYQRWSAASCSITSRPTARGASKRGCTSRRSSARRTSRSASSRRAPDDLVHGIDAGGHGHDVRALPRPGRRALPALVDPSEWRAADEAPWMMTALFWHRSAICGRRSTAGSRLTRARPPEGTIGADDGVAGSSRRCACCVDRGADVNKAAQDRRSTPLMVGAQPPWGVARRAAAARPRRTRPTCRSEARARRIAALLRGLGRQPGRGARCSSSVAPAATLADEAGRPGRCHSLDMRRLSGRSRLIVQPTGRVGPRT